MNQTELNTTTRVKPDCSVSFSLMVFAKKLLHLMRERGLSARALATHLALSNATVSAWTKDARPHPSQATALAEFFRVPVAALLDDEAPLPFSAFLEAVAEDVAHATAAYPNNPEAAAHLSDFQRLNRLRKKEAARLKAHIVSLVELARDLDPLDKQLASIHRVTAKLKSKMEKGASDEAQRELDLIKKQAEANLAQGETAKSRSSSAGSR